MNAFQISGKGSHKRLKPNRLARIIALSLLMATWSWAEDTPNKANTTNTKGRILELEQEISTIDKLLSTFREQLGALYDMHPSIRPLDSEEDRDGLSDEAKRLKDRISALEEDVQEKEELLKSMTSEDATDYKESSDILEQRIRDKKKELQELQEKLNQLKNRGNPSFKTIPSHLKSHIFILHENQIVPLTDEYTKCEGFTIGRLRYATLKKTRRGQTLAQAVGPRGCLTQVMSQHGPKEAYIKIFVCPDSVRLFEPVVEKLKAKDYWCSWDTLPGLPYSFTINGTGGGGGGEEPGF